ncbi:hypothetical protein KAJ27_02480 [bacterium]|nr:hypothetical protein [bacterium]
MDNFFNEFFDSGLKVYLYSEKDVNKYLKSISKGKKVNKEGLLVLKKKILKRLKEEKKAIRLLVNRELTGLIQENDELKERVRKLERYLDENAKKQK